MGHPREERNHPELGGDCEHLSTKLLIEIANQGAASMAINLDRLQPAEQREVGVYLPYYQGNKRAVLPRAISLYRQGNLEGERKIEGGDDISFVASWHVSSLPADLTRCRIQFDGDADLSYEVTMANFEFIDHLIEVIITHKRYHKVDFSKGFYRKLLQRDD